MLNGEERQALVNYRLEKAEETLKEAVDCGSLNHWTLAANRLYYAVYYASSALLIQNEMIVKTHAGVIALIGQKFVSEDKLSKSDAQLLARLQTMRHTGDYDDFMEWHKEEVEPLFEKVKDYIYKVKNIITKQK